ncbi:MAG: OPT/YSL family transporter [Phycisphaerae bacterium]|nr:OPT/YSL family transporter [Phycisphaerae bacterium]
MSKDKYAKELEQYRSLMEVPSTFEDGFTWTAVVGALFIALLMVPGGIYMQLLAGTGLGPAAQWVTIVLFIEVARRAQKHLRKAEIYVLFYMAGAIMAQPFAGVLYRQFFAQSQAATGMGIVEHLPFWFAPTDPDVLAQRNLFHPAWYPAIALVFFQTLMGRLNTTILTYGLFRLASDIEKMPFPMAPVGAQGINALVEQQTEESARGDEEGAGNWRWRVFSIGGVLGMSFGVLYTALPIISGAILDQPIQILPIPFVDWTQKTSSFLPAVATGLSLNLGQLVVGMVLPFFAMLGGFLAYVFMIIANPIMYNFGLLPSWHSSDDTILTLFHNYLDFYFSFGLGISFAIAVVGISKSVTSLRRHAALRKKQQDLPEEMQAERDLISERGDIKARWILSTYIFTSLTYVLISGWLIDWHPGATIALFILAFLYTPIISYVTARLEGMAGQSVTIPFIRETAFILSGYQGDVKIWFVPTPLANFGRRTVFYRQAELTGTKFWSLWKAEFILVPIVLVSALLFSNFIWTLAPIPGPQYPYAEMMWELNAATRCIIYTSTLGRHSAFSYAFSWKYLSVGFGVGFAMFLILGLFSLPIMIGYGIVRGLHSWMMPHIIPLQFIGACIGRFYFERKMGLNWRKYIPVVGAGFTCGMGLVTVLAVGINFLAKAVIKIPF